jgi:SAM-dependent methyltransferase
MSEIVRRYYNDQGEIEWARLESPYSGFELASTLRLIETYFPPACRVADIGGGPGRYTIELLQRGYRVTLVDLSDVAIDLASARLAECGLEAEAIHRADARDLGALEDSSFHAALMLGPMYHIVDAEGRAQALAELHRILRPGSPAVVGFINPWGVLRAGLTEFPDFYHEYQDAASLLNLYEKVGEQAVFTESVFLTPPQALAELRAAGFAVETRAGVEGFASGTRDAVKAIAETDPVAYENVRRLVVETCDHPAYRDCTEHLHVVVRCLK